MSFYDVVKECLEYYRKANMSIEQAFPQTVPEGDWSRPGMSLRDYMAIHFITGWFASYSKDAFHPCHESMKASAGLEVIREAYRLADLMLEERIK